MGETSERMIASKVLVALVNEGNNVVSKIAEIRGAHGERVLHHKENSNLHTGVFNLIKRLDRMDELKREEYLDNLEAYVGIMRAEKWSRNSHYGDLAAQAKEEDEPAPANGGMPLEEAEKAFEANAHLAPAPEEVDAKAEKRARGRRKKTEASDSVESFRESMRSEIAKGDAHIREVSAQLASNDDSAAPRRERRKPAKADGSYTILN
ncbi:hypothetical protein [Microvirga massiliensis]|uniref:hypothetical protein n=1 Tax=Microvirga massiliensis TaxID=1033741 RepID=UPI00062BE74D|nr:hypothetical protein [Microvirga massiliensis]